MFAYTKLMQAMAAAGVVSATDPYFNLVTLLLPGNGTNGAQNNTFLDSSTNNFTITRNGNTTQGTFSPFSQTGWSNYFDGSSAYLTLADNAAFEPGTGDFTIEAWVFDTVAAGTLNVYIAHASSGISFYRNASGKLEFAQDAVASLATSNNIIPPNTWSHVAVSRSGTTLKLFINGYQEASVTNSTNLAGTGSLGIGASSSGSNKTTGYISNLRLVKGTALYTNSFTPSTTPLTAVTNTQLLTCQSNRFIDNSSNAFAITVNGTPSVQAFSPFAPTAAYDTAVVGGSGYFDGESGDFLTVASNTAFDFTGNATIELWAYWTGNMGVRQDLIHHATNGFEILKLAGDTIYCGFGGGTITSSITVKAGQWYHIALVRSSTGANGLNLYINGVNVGSATAASSVTSSTMAIGAQASGGSPTIGYFSSLRIVKGTAVYTGAFTPPTAPLTAISGTSLLLNYTNGGIIDATGKNVLETVGNAQISTTQSKFGGSSMSFDGTGDWLLIPHTVDQMLGTGAFTIELWVYRNSSGTYGLVGKGTGTTGWLVSLNSSNQVVFTYGSSTITSSGTVSATTWTYIAVVREGTGSNQTKIYINGSNDGTGTVSTDFNQTNAMYVGADRTGGSAFNGYIDDLRITRGQARTVTTTPTSAFALQ